MHSRILRGMVVLGLLASIGGFADAGSQAAPVSAAAASASLVNPNPVAAGPYHSGNIQCAQDGTRINGTWDHYCPPGWHYAQVAAVDVAGSIAPAPVAAAPVAAPAAVKRETNVVVNVDFDATKPITVTGLPAFRAGSPELWGDNTGSISDAATDIVVKRIASGETTCPAADRAGAAPSSSVLDVNRAVGSTVQKFCVYPKHYETGSTSSSFAGFVAGQKYALNVWVYAP